MTRFKRCAFIITIAVLSTGITKTAIANCETIQDEYRATLRQYKELGEDAVKARIGPGCSDARLGLLRRQTAVTNKLNGIVEEGGTLNCWHRFTLENLKDLLEHNQQHIDTCLQERVTEAKKERNEGDERERKTEEEKRALLAQEQKTKEAREKARQAVRAAKIRRQDKERDISKPRL